MTGLWPWIWAILVLSCLAEASRSFAEIHIRRNGSNPQFARRLQVRQQDPVRSDSNKLPEWYKVPQPTVEQITKEKLDQYGLKPAPTTPPPVAPVKNSSSSNHSAANNSSSAA